jgi:hypothetical protein
LGDRSAFPAFDHSYESVSELNAATLDSNDDQIVRTPIQLDDLHRHALQGALDGPGIQNRRCFRSHWCTNMAPKST